MLRGCPNEPIRDGSSDGGAVLQDFSRRVLDEYGLAIAELARAAPSIGCSEGLAVLSQVQSRLGVLAEAHRALQAPSAGTIGLGGYLEGVCAAAATAQGRSCRLTLSLPSAEVAVPAAWAWRVGVIVAELLTNAVRHGRVGGQIAVEVRVSGQDLLCSVANEGCLCPCGAGDAARATIESLACHIGGRLERRARVGCVAVRLVVPLNAP